MQSVLKKLSNEKFVSKAPANVIDMERKKQRDGRRSYAVLLISSDDAERIAKRFEADYPPLEKIRSIYEKI